MHFLRYIQQKSPCYPTHPPTPRRFQKMQSLLAIWMIPSVFSLVLNAILEIPSTVASSHTTHPKIPIRRFCLKELHVFMDGPLRAINQMPQISCKRLLCPEVELCHHGCSPSLTGDHSIALQYRDRSPHQAKLQHTCCHPACTRSTAFREFELNAACIPGSDCIGSRGQLIFILILVGGLDHTPGYLFAVHFIVQFCGVFTQMMPGLRTMFGRIIVPEQLGFGFSDKPVQHLLLVSRICVRVLRYTCTVKYGVNTHPLMCNSGGKYGVGVYPGLSSKIP